MAGNLAVGSINDAGFTSNNLVMNPEFTVNQRAAASRTAATGYNFDRWYYDGTNLLQGIENLNLRNTTYVVSWEGSSTCSYSLNTVASSSQSGQSYTSVANGGTITVSSLSSNNLWLKFNGDLTNLTKVKLVEGNVASDFTSRLHPQELVLCQRYFKSATNQPLGLAVGNYGYFTAIQFPVTMRTAPTISGLSYSSTNGGTAGAAVTTTVGVDGFAHYNSSNNTSVNYIYQMSYSASAEL